MKTIGILIVINTSIFYLEKVHYSFSYETVALLSRQDPRLCDTDLFKPYLIDPDTLVAAALRLACARVEKDLGSQ